MSKFKILGFLLLIFILSVGGYWFYSKIWLSKTQINYLEHNSLLFDSNLYLEPVNIRVKKGDTIPVPIFKTGRIAFIKNGDLWIAENNGFASRVTNARENKSEGLFEANSIYKYPVWSPDGDKLAFIQTISLGTSDLTRHLITDGKQIVGDEFRDYEQLPPYWFNNEEILIPSISDFWPKTISKDKDGLHFDTNRPKNTPLFNNGYSVADGCGGGGRPEWSYKLSDNHLGGMDGIRASLFYLPSLNQVIYSTGCESHVSLRKSPSAKRSEWFDVKKKPSELLLSLDKNWIVGTEKRNVVLYDSKAKFVKILWNSGKAYGPVFSQDSKFIYFADNFGAKPSLIEVDLNSGNSRTVFTSGKVGAISNISISPDDSQIIFTLIKETATQGYNPEYEWYSEAKEDIYLIDSEGRTPTLFVEDASQSAWSPKQLGQKTHDR